MSKHFLQQIKTFLFININEGNANENAAPFFRFIFYLVRKTTDTHGKAEGEKCPEIELTSVFIFLSLMLSGALTSTCSPSAIKIWLGHQLIGLTLGVTTI